MTDFTRHGGRLAAAMRAWPGAPSPWLDLSTGINPRPYPAPRASNAARARLPFPEEIAALEAAAASAFGVRQAAQAAAAPGAETALRLLPRLLNAQTAFIDGPTYASHAPAWTSVGARLVQDEDVADVVVVVDPNNPDGRVQDREALLARAEVLSQRGGWLVADESFADARGGDSIAAVGHPRILALRSFGKFYGLAGLRLGFLLGPAPFVRGFRAALGDWPVSADALAAGLAAYPDTAWAARTRIRLAHEAARLDKALAACGFEIVGGASLFRLARAPDAQSRFEALCAEGILTRPFAEAPDWLRFGLPRSRHWPRLEAALASLA